ncbi:MAG: L-serine ammonia-lyase, iron-sulfur-dependent, subunit alpha [Patescibacteria group bacterium]
MSLLKQILGEEVKLACGCTEPIAVAYACNIAMRAIGEQKDVAHIIVKNITITLDPGTYKNGRAVGVPNTKGRTGFTIAAALGCLNPSHANPLQILEKVESETLAEAEELINANIVTVNYDESWQNFCIHAKILTSHGQALVVIQNNHTNITSVEVDGVVAAAFLSQSEKISTVAESSYQELLKKMTIRGLVSLAETMDEETGRFIQQGVEVNLALAEAGKKIPGFGASLNRQNINNTDITSRIKMEVACATDARMSGSKLPAMSSGGSGNQGIVAILVPYIFGTSKEIPRNRVLQSIALSHLINAYVKTQTGILAPICGCAMAAGLGAAAAIVYQIKNDITIIGHAINNVAGSINGILCDGAKSGCALKVISAVDAAVTAALFALDNTFVSPHEGVVGKTPEETIRNLGILCIQGMCNTNGVVLQIGR